MARPKVRATSGPMVAQPDEELSSGYILHQHKKFNGDMRWGQLWTGQGDDGRNRCIMSLYKFNIANPKPLVLARKDLKLKASFEFSEDDFCGLEKGEHFSRHGRKRFICVILKDKHIILQDAVIAMTDGEQDVIGTWYRKITDSMQYLYRWSILGSADPKFLHVSRVNMCECFSVHNSNAGQKGKLLLSQMYKTKSIVKLEEFREILEGKECMRVAFFDESRDMDKKISILLEHGKKLSEVLIKNNHSLTLAGRFDILDDSPNLIKIKDPEFPKPRPKPSKSLKELSKRSRFPEKNNYIDAASSEASYYNNHQDRLQGGRHPPGEMSRDELFPRNNIPPGGPGRESSRDHACKPVPRHHGDTRPFHDPRDDSKNITRNSLVDSGYATQTNASQEIDMAQPNGISNPNIVLDRGVNFDPYVNIPADRASPINCNGNEGQPPIVPPRAPIGGQVEERNQHDPIRQVIQRGDFPPIGDHPDFSMTAYENNSRTGLAVTISTLLERNEAERIDTSFGLPYSVFRELLLGLEAQSSTGGDWRGLATELGMTFDEVEQIDTAVLNHPQLYALEIVLLHWQRAQAPILCTLRNLKKILTEKMGRLDLADLIHLSRDKENESTA